MGFSVDSFMKIKEVVDIKENYTVCKCTISKKNKVKNKTECCFSAYVRFIGNAHKQKPMADQKIKITSCDVTNCYVKDDKVEMTKNPQYVVFGYELQEQGQSVVESQDIQRPTLYTLDDDSDIPF